MFLSLFRNPLCSKNIAFKTEPDLSRVLGEVGRKLRQDEPYNRIMLADVEILGMDNLGDSRVTIKMRFKACPLKQWQVAR
jgi:hypothetical protein